MKPYTRLPIFLLSKPFLLMALRFLLPPPITLADQGGLSAASPGATLLLASHGSGVPSFLEGLLFVFRGLWLLLVSLPALSVLGFPFLPPPRPVGQVSCPRPSPLTL